MAPNTDRFEQATQNWVSAVRVYRMSVDLYNRMLQARGARVLRFDERQTISRPGPTNGTGADAPGRSTRSLALDGLTVREREVARLIALGYTNRQIADKLVITRGTAANHVAHILQKLGATNRTQVAAALLAAGSGSTSDGLMDPRADNPA